MYGQVVPAVATIIWDTDVAARRLAGFNHAAFQVCRGSRRRLRYHVLLRFTDYILSRPAEYAPADPLEDQIAILGHYGDSGGTQRHLEALAVLDHLSRTPRDPPFH